MWMDREKFSDVGFSESGVKFEWIGIFRIEYILSASDYKLSPTTPSHTHRHRQHTCTHSDSHFLHVLTILRRVRNMWRKSNFILLLNFSLVFSSNFSHWQEKELSHTCFFDILFVTLAVAISFCSNHCRLKVFRFKLWLTFSSEVTMWRRWCEEWSARDICRRRLFALRLLEPRNLSSPVAREKGCEPKVVFLIRQSWVKMWWVVVWWVDGSGIEMSQ